MGKGTGISSLVPVRLGRKSSCGRSITSRGEGRCCWHSGTALTLQSPSLASDLPFQWEGASKNGEGDQAERFVFYILLVEINIMYMNWSVRMITAPVYSYIQCPQLYYKRPPPLKLNYLLFLTAHSQHSLYPYMRMCVCAFLRMCV
jgi:hypothetical protein